MKTDDELRAENQAIRDMLARGPEAELYAIPGVVHVSVGLKQVHGIATDQLCVRVYVKEKRDRKDIPASEVIPAEIHGVPTDVNTVGQFELHADSTSHRPIKGGIQITNRIIAVNDAGTGTQMSRGTLGCIAIDNTDNAPVLLTNWHVLTANGGRNGDKVFQPAPTSLPQVSLLDLPLRPPDDNDKIGVLRRSVISNKVDGAIAAIDVSSCCNCCGIHYSNELHGISVANVPPKSTIVGQAAATGGMRVFKVGQATGRTEGRVVDPNYPSFSISSGGTNYPFTGQIAIQNVDATAPFGAHGDSGSVVMDQTSNIVGLYFASGRNVMVSGAPVPFLSLANHIADVLSALNIRIQFSPNIVMTRGATLVDLPTVLEAPIPEPYRVARERWSRSQNTANLLAIGQRHSREVTYLVNHSRRVTIAWQRSNGPAWLATIMGSIRDGHDRIPEAVKGTTLHEGLVKMRAALMQYGSPELRASLARPEADFILEAVKGCSDLDEIFARIAAGPRIIADPELESAGAQT